MVVVTSNLKEHLARYTTITVAMLESQEGLEPEQERFFLTLQKAKESGDCRAESVGRFDIPEMELDVQALELGIIQTVINPIGHLTVTSGLTGIATSPLKPLYTLLPNPDIRQLSIYKEDVVKINDYHINRIDERRYLIQLGGKAFYLDIDGDIKDTRFLYKDNLLDITTEESLAITNITRELKDLKMKPETVTLSDNLQKPKSFSESNPEFLSELKRIYEVTY